MTEKQIPWFLVALVWLGAALSLARPGRAQPDPPAPRGKVLVFEARAHKMLADAAHFHGEPWGPDADPKTWKQKYTAAAVVELKDAKVGDSVTAHHHLMFVIRGSYDIRRPGKKYPLAAQVSVHCRTLTAYPPKLVVDLPPSVTEAVLGSLRDGPGVDGVFGTNYGEDMTAGGRFQDLDLGLPVNVGNPYYVNQQTTRFTVTRTPCFVVWWVQPESQGADGTCVVKMPGNSNYQEVWVTSHRSLP